MRKKFLIVTSLSLASVVTATAAIACAPIDQSIKQDQAEEKLKQIVNELTNKSWTANVKDEVDVVKSQFESIASDYKNKLLNLISDGDYLGYLLGGIKITKMEVANASEYVINLKLSFSYEENGVVATREGYLNIVNFALKDWERVARFLSTEIEKFTDRKLKKDSSNKQLLPAKSDINSLESWNNNTVGEPISFDKDINVTITRTQSDTAKGISVFEVKLEKLGQIREKTIKVRGFKTKYLDRNEKAVEATVNNFILTKATLDRGDIYFPEGMIHDWNGTRKSHSNEFRIDHEKWAKVNSNSHLRASAFKPTILDNQKFEQSQYFDHDAYKYLQARLLEKNKIKLEEGVTGEVKVISADDIKGEVIISITFVKGEARSEEKLVTISNFLSRRELVGIAFDTYYESLKKWNEQDKITKPAFTNKETANKYIETVQKIFDDKVATANNVKLKLEVNPTKGGIDYKNQKIYLLGTYSIGNLVIGTEELVLEGFNDKLSDDHNLVLFAYNEFNKFDYQVREPQKDEKVDAKWVASLQDIDTIEKLNDKLPEGQKISWTNQDKGVNAEVKTIDFLNKEGSVTLELIFKKGNVKSEPIKITLSGFLTEKQVLDQAVEVFKHALDHDKNDKNQYEDRIKHFVLYLKSNPRNTLDDQGLLQMVAYQAYVTNLLNYGDEPAGIKGLSELTNGATLIFKNGGLAGEWDFVVHYGSLVSETFTLNIPYAQTQDL